MPHRAAPWRLAARQPEFRWPAVAADGDRCVLGRRATARWKGNMPRRTSRRVPRNVADELSILHGARRPPSEERRRARPGGGGEQRGAPRPGGVHEVTRLAQDGGHARPATVGRRSQNASPPSPSCTERSASTARAEPASWQEYLSHCRWTCVWPLPLACPDRTFPTCRRRAGATCPPFAARTRRRSCWSAADFTPSAIVSAYTTDGFPGAPTSSSPAEGQPWRSGAAGGTGTAAPTQSCRRPERSGGGRNWRAMLPATRPTRPLSRPPGGA